MMVRRPKATVALANQQASRDTDDGGERKNLLNKLGKEFVGGHSDDNQPRQPG
jgi:hypothetical protein